MTARRNDSFLHRLASLLVCLISLSLALGLPLWGIAGPLPDYFVTLPMNICYGILFGSFVMAGWWRDFSLKVFLSYSLKIRLTILGALIYASLYLASALLCLRLKLALLPDWISWLGVFILALATATWFAGLRSLLASRPAFVAYPQFLALLLYALGLALSHRVWFPLLALPGIFVAIVWHLNGRAAPLDNTQTPARYKILPFFY
jgi:hypothetical protein